MEQQHDEAWWQAHLDAIEREDIPTKHYAQREGLPVAQLYAWRKRIKERARRGVVTCTDVSRFVAVRLEPAPVPVSISAPAPVPSNCTLLTVSGIRLEMPQLPSPQWLVELDARLRQGRS